MATGFMLRSFQNIRKLKVAWLRRFSPSLTLSTGDFARGWLEVNEEVAAQGLDACITARKLLESRNDRSIRQVEQSRVSNIVHPITVGSYCLGIA